MHDDKLKKGAFSWSELMTRDPSGSIRFYTDLLGWEIVECPMGDEPYYVVQVDGEGVAGIMRMPAEIPPEVPTHWSTYITVEDVDALAASVPGNGGTVVEPPKDIPDVGRFCVVQDPGGATVCFISYIEEPSGDPPFEGVHGSVVWSEQQSHDPAARADFLRALVGFDLRRHTVDGRTYYVLPLDGSSGDLAEPLQPNHCGPADADSWIGPQDPECWLTFVQVDDVDGLADKVVPLGGTVVVPPTDITGIGRYCTIKDPQGASISLITYFDSRMEK